MSVFQPGLETMKLGWMMVAYVAGGIILGAAIGAWLGQPVLVAVFGAFVGAALGVAFRL